MAISLEVNGCDVSVPEDHLGSSLLEVLRDVAGVISAKDGCAPQGQCGCCTVLVDGKARVACVTPVRRVAGRSVTTLEGLETQARSIGLARSSITGPPSAGSALPA
ncbi:MAG: 2Fe-2S iron-sulfur cluster-binding protein [Microthrixaceae bacterium]